MRADNSQTIEQVKNEPEPARGELEFLTAQEVARLLKCSRSQVYKLHTQGLLPPPVHLFAGDRGARWIRREVEEFLLRSRSTPREQQKFLRPFVPLAFE